jgi:hypothetical protein
MVDPFTNRSSLSINCLAAGLRGTNPLRDQKTT